jgi:hypothetical protein
MMMRSNVAGRTLGLLIATAVVLGPAPDAWQGVIGPAIAQAQPKFPKSPANPAAALGSQGSVVVSWSDRSDNEEGFRIIRERLNDRSKWVEAAGFTVSANVMQYVDTPGPGEWGYRIRAYNRSGQSSYTSRVTITVPDPSGGGTGGSTGGSTGGVVTVNNSGGTGGSTGGGTGGTGGSGSGGGISSAGFPILVPGSGWSGPTPQPAAVGSPGMPGHDAKAIARWDVVPYQTFTGEFHIGVVAFHMNGIEKVSFAVNGGPWVDVPEMKLNPRTGVWEYTATLEASRFTSGQVEVRAIAWPKEAGAARVLGGSDLTVSNGEHSMILNADRDGQILASRQVRWVAPWGEDGNPGTESAPFATIKRAAMHIRDAQGGRADGGLIYLQPGDYPFAGSGGTWEVNTQSAYLTITRAPGATREQVRITVGGSTERLNATLIHLREVTVAAGLVNSANLARPSLLWLDGVLGTRYNRFASLEFTGFTTFATDCTFREVRKGFVGGQLVRNHQARHLGEDGFFNPSVLINVSVDDINRAGWESQSAILQGEPHPDVVQWYDGSGVVLENRVVYGLKSSNVVGSQGIFFKGVSGMLGRDIALVNLAVQADNNQWHMPVNHLLIWQSAFSHNLIFRDAALFSAGNVRNISLRQSVFDNLVGAGSSPSLVIMDNNHFIREQPWGQRATFGDPGWSSSLRPLAGSPLQQRVDALLAPIDAEGNAVLLGAGSIGALQPLSNPSGGH